MKPQFLNGSSALLGLSALLGFSVANGQTDAPTFYADALPLFQKNCVVCHQPDGPDVGGISAPMSLLDYEQARLWAPMIKNALLTGYMPRQSDFNLQREDVRGSVLL